VCADVVVLGVLAAVVGSFVPVYPALMVGAALAFAIASLIVGERAGSGRMLLGSLVAAVIALVLNLPWALGVLPSDAPRWTVLGVPARQAVDHGFTALASFDIGPNRFTVLALGLTLPLVAALSPPAPTGSRGRDGPPCWLRAGWAPRLVDRGTLPASPTMISVFLAPYRSPWPSVRPASWPASPRTSGGRRSAGASSSAWSPSLARSSGWCPCCRRW
jgi:hypothetical protein